MTKKRVPTLSDQIEGELLFRFLMSSYIGDSHIFELDGKKIKVTITSKADNDFRLRFEVIDDN